MLINVSPDINLRRFSQTMSIIRSPVTGDPPAECVVIITFGIFHNGLSEGNGSCSGGRSSKGNIGPHRKIRLAVWTIVKWRGIVHPTIRTGVLM